MEWNGNLEVTHPLLAFSFPQRRLRSIHHPLGLAHIAPKERSQRVLLRRVERNYTDVRAERSPQRGIGIKQRVVEVLHEVDLCAIDCAASTRALLRATAHVEEDERLKAAAWVRVERGAPFGAMYAWRIFNGTVVKAPRRKGGNGRVRTVLGVEKPHGVADLREKARRCGRQRGRESVRVSVRGQ